MALIKKNVFDNLASAQFEIESEETEHSEKKAKEKKTIPTIIKSGINAPEKTIVLRKIQLTPEPKLEEEESTPIVVKTQNPPEITGTEKAEQSARRLAEKPTMPKISPAIKIDEKALQKNLTERKSQIENEISVYRQEALTKINEEKQKIFDAAYKEGIEKGKKEGEAALNEEASTILKTINEAIIEKNRILRMARGEVLKLAIKVAEQILKSEISLNQAVCVNIVAEAISKITDKDRVIIRVNRVDAEFVKMNRDRILKQLGDVRNLTIQEDSRIDQGGCIIETDLGYIDSTISTKLESIERAIFKVYEEEMAEEASGNTETND